MMRGAPPDDVSVRGYIDPELYDAAYGWWRDDIPFYVGLARAAHGPVLEASAPMEVKGCLSVNGRQVAPASVVFHMPPATPPK